MHFQVEGRAAPEALSRIFDEIVDRLSEAGVEEVSSISVRLKALIDGEELEAFVTPLGAMTDAVKLYSPTVAFEEREKDYLAVAMLRQSDLTRIMRSIDFLSALDFSYWEIGNFLEIPAGDLRAFSEGKLAFELDVHSRECVTAYGTMIEAALELFPNLEAAIEWFRGEHAHSKLTGDTPRQQLLAGHLTAANTIAATFRSLLPRARVGKPLPMLASGNYDLDPGE